MAYSNSEAFGLFGLYEDYNGRQIGHYGREILELAETSGDDATVHDCYLKSLGVLGMYGTEVARARVLYGNGEEAQAVMAEHVFYLRQDPDGTELESFDGDGESHDLPGGVHVAYDRKTSTQAIGSASGEVALQYDGLANPPVLRVIDVMGHIQDGHGNWGEPRSIIPDGMLTDLQTVLA